LSRAPASAITDSSSEPARVALTVVETTHADAPTTAPGDDFAAEHFDIGIARRT
jgi:hypothetical protein